MTEPLVSIHDLVKSYGETHALRGISFDVPEGSIFGVIGPNGAGKTTTFRILATLLDSTAGVVRIDGMSVEDHPEAIRRIVGYMPDHFGVYEGITVEEYLEFFASAFRIPAGRRRSVIRDVMVLTDLTELRDRMVSSLSRGMKQRLCLAKTLVHDPRLLILDEPAASLDPRARIELRALLKELRRMGKTIIISSHILTELSGLCDAVAIIEKGELVRSGSLADLERGHPGSDRVRIELHEPRPEVEALLGRHCPAAESIRGEGKEVHLEYRGRPEEFYRVLKVLTDHSIPILAVERRSRNLEDIFMELTRGDVG